MEFSTDDVVVVRGAAIAYIEIDPDDPQRTLEEIIDALKQLGMITLTNQGTPD